MKNRFENHPWVRSSFGGHTAGDGILEDDYSETSGNKRVKFEKYSPKVKFTTDKYDPSTMNGPVIIVQEGKKKHDNT